VSIADSIRLSSLEATVVTLEQRVAALEARQGAEPPLVSPPQRPSSVPTDALKVANPAPDEGTKGLTV
jgi:hypothetical protein